jgi:hypothetical protein
MLREVCGGRVEEDGRMWKAGRGMLEPLQRWRLTFVLVG